MQKANKYTFRSDEAPSLPPQTDRICENIQATFTKAMYVPLVFPVLAFGENILRSSSREKAINIFKVKPAINAVVIIHGTLKKTKQNIERASSAVTRSRNLYPPSFFSMCGATRSPRIETTEANT